MASRLTAVFAVLALFGVFAVVPAEWQGSVGSDMAAVVALYDATDGLNWRRCAYWKIDAPLSEWEGVETTTT